MEGFNQPATASVPIRIVSAKGFISLRCAVSVQYASSRYELSRAFSIPRQKCFRAGFFDRKSLKRNVSAVGNRTYNLLIKSQPPWPRAMASTPSENEEL